MDVTTVEIATSQKEIINPLGDFGCCYADSTGLVLHCAWLKKIYGCSCFCWSKIVLSGWWLKTVLFLSFTYTKLILFLLPCNLFVCGSFELYPNGKFTKKEVERRPHFSSFYMGTFQIVVADVSSNLQEYWYTIYKQDDFFCYARLYLSTDGLLPCRFGRLR